MKISKERLKQIVQEELAIGVVPTREADRGYTRDPSGYEGRMAKQNLWKLANYAQELHHLIADDENLEPWVEEKIAVASFMIDSVAHYVEYEKLRASEEQGNCGHVELSSEMQPEAGGPVGIEVTGTGVMPDEEGEEEEYEFEPDEEEMEFDEEGEEEEYGEPEEYEPEEYEGEESEEDESEEESDEGEER